MGRFLPHLIDLNLSDPNAFCKPIADGADPTVSGIGLLAKAFDGKADWIKQLFDVNPTAWRMGILSLNSTEESGKEPSKPLYLLRSDQDRAS